MDLLLELYLYLAGFFFIKRTYPRFVSFEPFLLFQIISSTISMTNVTALGVMVVLLHIMRVENHLASIQYQKDGTSLDWG